MLAALVVSPLVGCGGGSSDDDSQTTTTTAPPPTTTPQSTEPTPTTPPPTTKHLKIAYEPDRDLSTVWADDKSIIAVGLGNYESADFAILYGEIANEAGRLGFTVESRTKWTYHSLGDKLRVVVDKTNPALITAHMYEDGAFVSGRGFFSQGGQNYVGAFDTNTTPSVSALKDVQPVTQPVPTTTSQKVSLLEGLLRRVIPSAQAVTIEEIQGQLDSLTNWIHEIAVTYGPVVAAFFVGLSVCQRLKGPKVLFCGIGAALVVLIVFAIAKALASDKPPPIFMRELPPPGTIPYGKVIYVDDGQCPVGRIKKVTGGNMDLDIPRRIECVSLLTPLQ